MNILKNAYNREDFRVLINNIFQKSGIFLDIPEDQEVSDEGKNKIESGYLLGELNLDGKDFAIFEYKVKDELDLEKNKVGLVRKLIKNGKDYLFDAFLGVYYNEKTNIWRLSLVNIEYTENKEKTSSLKRYTYLLGENIPVNTAIKQIKTELIDKKVNNIDALLKAFSVEPVTKEFFKRYKEIFEEFNDYSYKNNANAQLFNNISSDIHKKIRDFNKKLLGRLVFLMFLPKKGWLDAKSSDYIDGNKNFLSDLYEKAIKEDKLFYNEYLEPLFYDTLNKKRENDIFLITGKKVPFLNGGLFEKEKYESNVLMNFPNKLFSLLLDKEKGLFNQYNFTIIENDSTDQEVAVDPEMLGHIFENLLEDNKDKGAFYTPKEIVNYMSKSSLLEYLKNGFDENKGKLEENEEKILKELVFSPEIADFRINFIKNNKDLINFLLDNVKILDPAIGSGAFPMGMLQAIIRVKEVLNHDLNRGEAKRNIIENSIYGVDIENGAVDIAKLRFWLSLVVDEDKPTPLPNLDFKIVEGNSLVSILKIGNLKETIDLSPLKENKIKLENFELLKKAKNNFYEGKGNKRELKKEIRKYETDILTNILEYKIMALESSNGKYCQKDFSGKPKNHKKCEEYKRKKVELEQTLEDIKTKDYSIFDYYLNFNEVFQENNGFNIVIGNPPYIKEATNRNAFNGFRETSPYYIGKMDLWYGFTCIGIDLLKDNGAVCFIATNNWITSSGAKKLRNKILKDVKILEFIDFGDFKVFESAGIQTMIMNLLKTNNNTNYVCQYSKIINKKMERKKIINFLNKKKNNDFSIFLAKVVKKDLENENIVFLEKRISDILTKIKCNQNFNLNSKLEVAQGIVTPNDNVNKNSLKKLNNSFLGEGIFILNTEEKNNFKYSEREMELIKPLYTTDEINKFYFNKKNNFWVVYTDSKFKNPKNILPYPNIKRHLDRFKNIITSDNKPYGLHRSRNEFFFKGEKILAIRKSTKYPRFSYSYFDTYVNQSFNIIKSNRINLKYLTSLLNSKLIAFWLKYKGKMQGDNYQLDKEPLLNIPIKNIENTKPFESLVDEIISLKKEEKETKLLEDKIDLMFYKLYDLNYDEIKIIDPDFDVVLDKFGIDKVRYEGMNIEELVKL